MLMLLFFSAVIYVIFNLPFESGMIVFDLKDFQPVSALPVILGLFFGPAGVLGTGLGNLAVDLYDGLSLMTPFLLAGNMLMALLSYKLWDKFFLQQDSEIEIPKRDKRGFVINLAITVLAASMAKALIAGTGSASLFYKKGLAIFINDSIGGFIIALVIIFVFLKRLKKWEMLWTEIMSEQDIGTISLKGAYLLMGSVILLFATALAGSYLGSGLTVFISGFAGLLMITTGIFIGGRKS